MPRTPTVHAEVRHRHTGQPEADAGWRGFDYDIVYELLCLHDCDSRDVVAHFAFFRGRHRCSRDWHGRYFWELQDMCVFGGGLPPGEFERAKATRDRLSTYGMAFVCGIVPNFDGPPRYRLTEGKRQRL